MHIPVLLQEVTDGLHPQPGEVVLDATVGGGGHSEALCHAMEGTGTFICLDADSDALKRSRERLSGCGCEFHFIRENFRNLDAVLSRLGVERIDRALFDLGLSSFTLEESGRGFSFLRDEPLLMTFEKNGGALTAETIVNEWSEVDIERILREYAGEWRAKRIASAIQNGREKSRIRGTRQLAEIVAQALRPRRSRIHPATKTFQALRIAVNDELTALRAALPKAFERLHRGGRLAVISFQSLEDRAVKGFFREQAKSGSAAVVTKKPVAPSREEVQKNPRARSAKLRIIEKI